MLYRFGLKRHRCESRSVRHVPAAARAVVVVTFVLTLAAPGVVLRAAEEHPLVPYLKVARSSRDAAAQVRDYEASFTKSELVGRTLSTDQMIIKHRKDPFSVYLRFLGKNDGREVLYVDGKNQGKLIAHEGPGSLKSIVGSVSLDPMSPQATADGRHPITEIGFLKMIESLIRQWEEETKYGETQVKFFPDAKLGGVACKVIESTHPVPRRQFKFHVTRLYIDKSTNLPVRVEQWGFPRGGAPPQIVEEYTYTNIKPNSGMSDADFDAHNRNYRFY